MEYLTKRRRWILRIVFVIAIIVSVLSLIGSYQAYKGDIGGTFATETEKPLSEREQVAPPRDHITVFTAQDPKGAIFAIDKQGRPLYHNSTYDAYFDVDQVPGTSTTVMYVAVEKVYRGQCDPCTRNIIEQVNLTTGEVTRLYTRLTYMVSDWHDVDRVDNETVVIARIGENSITRVNHRTGHVEWSWEAQSHFDLSTGGRIPGDFTHLNDVEVLPDGRVMASIRNQDQVIFIRQNGTVDEDWTLGSEDDHSILYEQHNPDYLSGTQNDSAILVADSENNRVIEYQRQEGKWTQSWVYETSRIIWPRDADRLPNGHTLITNTNNDEIIEINRQGEVVWQVQVDYPYEAERLNTGVESQGPTAKQANLTSRLPSDTIDDTTEQTSNSLARSLFIFIRDLLPGWVFNGILFIMPPWVTIKDVFALSVVTGTVGVWGTLELYWSPLSVRIRWPLSVGWRKQDTGADTSKNSDQSQTE